MVTWKQEAIKSLLPEFKEKKWQQLEQNSVARELLGLLMPRSSGLMFVPYYSPQGKLTLNTCYPAFCVILAIHFLGTGPRSTCSTWCIFALTSLALCDLPDPVWFFPPRRKPPLSAWARASVHHGPYPPGSGGECGPAVMSRWPVSFLVPSCSWDLIGTLVTLGYFFSCCYSFSVRWNSIS